MIAIFFFSPLFLVIKFACHAAINENTFPSNMVKSDSAEDSILRTSIASDGSVLKIFYNHF